MNEVSRTCTLARLNPAGFGAGGVVRGGAGLFEGVGVGVERGFGVGVGVGEAEALGDGEDGDEVGRAFGFLCEHAPSISPDTHRRATKRAAVREFIDSRTYPLFTPGATGRGDPGPAPGNSRVAKVPRFSPRAPPSRRA